MGDSSSNSNNPYPIIKMSCCSFSFCNDISPVDFFNHDYHLEQEDLVIAALQGCQANEISRFLMHNPGNRSFELIEPIYVSGGDVLVSKFEFLIPSGWKKPLFYGNPLSLRVYSCIFSFMRNGDKVLALPV